MWRLWPVGTSGVCGVDKCGACTWEIEQLIFKNYARSFHEVNRGPIFTDAYCVTGHTRARFTSECSTTPYFRRVKVNVDLTDKLDVESVSRSDDIATSGDDNVTSGSTT